MRKNVKKITQILVRKIQKIFIIAALFVVYLIGFGITWIFAVIFKRNLLGTKGKNKNTFWVGAKDCEKDIEQLEKGS